MQEPTLSASGLPLAFPGLMVVVGGGTVDAEMLRGLHATGGRLVGADGGADSIAAAGLIPEVIIGDFDSLSDAGKWPDEVRLIPIAEQETTDFEKVLYSTTAPLTVAMGMTGGRFDHTLAALDAVTRWARARRIILVDEHDIALALTGPFAFTVAANERVSVHPLGPIRSKGSRGLLYPLDGLRLAPGERTGTSNAATTGPFVIEPELGQDEPWLLILERKHLPALVETLLESG